MWNYDVIVLFCYFFIDLMNFSCWFYFVVLIFLIVSILYHPFLFSTVLLNFLNFLFFLLPDLQPVNYIYLCQVRFVDFWSNFYLERTKWIRHYCNCELYRGMLEKCISLSLQATYYWFSRRKINKYPYNSFDFKQMSMLRTSVGQTDEMYDFTRVLEI